MGKSKMIEWLESEEGQKSIEEFWTKIKFERDRNDRIVASMDFDILLKRILDKANSNKNIYRIVNILFDVAEREGKVVDEYLSRLSEHFPSTTIKYKDYYFEFVYGQGTAVAIYDENKKCLYCDI